LLFDVGDDDSYKHCATKQQFALSVVSALVTEKQLAIYTYVPFLSKSYRLRFN